MPDEDLKGAKYTPHFTRNRDRSDVPDSLLLEQAQRWIVRHNVEHLHGPEEEISYEKDELVVLCLLRNGKPYIKSFVEHYFSLGVKHIVFLDNGSTDGTVEALRGYENVTILRTGLPYTNYNVSIKQYLIERFGQQRWTLSVDIDELFDYPYSDAVGLRALLGYLSEHRYTAVVSYMLDMFPEVPLSDVPVAVEDEPLKELYRFYDISGVRVESYDQVGEIGNMPSNEDIGILRGGIRRTLFDNNALLTKHPLIFFDGEVKPMDLSDHWVSNARIADITGVLLHYKFSNRMYEDVKRSVEERNRTTQGTRRYAKYLEILKKNPTLQIKSKTSRELESVNELIGTPFAVVSREYIRLADGEVREKPDRLQSDGPGEMFKPFFKAREEARIRGQKAEWLRLRTRRLRKQFRRERNKASSLEKRVRALETRLESEPRDLQESARELERQLQDLQASWAWKALSALGLLKKKGLVFLGGVRARTRGEK